MYRYSNNDDLFGLLQIHNHHPTAVFLGQQWQISGGHDLKRCSETNTQVGNAVNKK